MKSMTELPGDYEAWDTVELSNKRLVFLLTVLATIAFFLFGLLFLFAAFHFAPPPSNGSTILSFPQLLAGLLIFLLVTFVVLIVHELIHALFFWLFTRKWPTFGFKGFYAYAAAPKWYIPRRQFIVVGMAPFVLITLAGLALLPLAPFPATLIVVLALTLNASGAVGDLYIVAWLLRKPGHILIRDFGTGMVVYGCSRNKQ
ncbi:MAG: DUF3267 domain-containing protein [Ktedonobacteraceae bacterium]|nr:DUF3267 domain-containing protein [Ktedonobacteraceae bacterium]